MEHRLIAASGAGDVSTVRKLLRKKVSLGVKDEYGRTALSFASSGVKHILHSTAGHAEIVRLLLEAGADVNERLGSHFTALHVAAKNNQATAVKYLIVNGAQVDAKSYNSIPPVGLCQYGSDTWTILRNASKGNLPEIDKELEVPQIPPHSLPAVTADIKKSGKEKKRGKKGKQGKKTGKKSGKRKGKKK